MEILFYVRSYVMCVRVRVSLRRPDRLLRFSDFDFATAVVAAAAAVLRCARNFRSFITMPSQAFHH
jgi:hypothetical protein